MRPRWTPALPRVIALGGCAALIAALIWLDQHRAGPVNDLLRCTLALSRSSESAADVLIIGSSRTGVALDPVAMQRILGAEIGQPIRVDRLAINWGTSRAMDGLLDTYLGARGSPRIVVIELMVVIQRTIDSMIEGGLAHDPEDYLYRRDVNLLRFDQILAQQFVAMPFTTEEGVLDLWSQRLRGVVLRSGALLYEALHRPTREWSLSACAAEDWRRGGMRAPPEFAFSYGDFTPGLPLPDLVTALEADVAREAAVRELAQWQSSLPAGLHYPYDLHAPYRRSDAGRLATMIQRALDHDAEVILLPLPLYGHAVERADLQDFGSRFGARVEVFDLYGTVRVDFGALWYDDAHVERSSVGALTTTLMARRLLQSQALHRQRPEPDG